MEIKKLDGRKSGHSLLLGAVLDKELQENVQTLREAGAIINTAIVTAIVKKSDSNLHQCNGGHITITKSWTKSFLNRMEYAKRRASTKAKVAPANFEAYKEQFVFM